MFDTEQLNRLRQAIGVTDADADAPTILNALDEALAEQSETVTHPEGTVVIDEATLASLTSDAAAGREARNTQQADRRTALVAAAVADGRISNQRAEHWNATLAADPGAEADLAGLAKGLIPLNEVGHAASGPHQADDVDTVTYNLLYGNAAASTQEV